MLTKALRSQRSSAGPPPRLPDGLSDLRRLSREGRDRGRRG